MDYRQTVHANELEYHKYNSVLSTLNWDRMATPDKYTPEEYHRLYTESYRLRKEAAGRLHADRMAFIRSHRESIQNHLHPDFLAYRPGRRYHLLRS